MKKRSTRMARVHGLAESEERDYCRVMGEAQQNLDAQQTRLDDLRAYRQEYAGRRPANGVVNSVQWADYQNFLARLDDAVHAQTQLVDDSRKNRDLHRQRWMQKRQKMESLQRVVGRLQLDESRAEERQQQKAQDDLPAQVQLFKLRS